MDIDDSGGVCLGGSLELGKTCEDWFYAKVTRHSLNCRYPCDLNMSFIDLSLLCSCSFQVVKMSSVPDLRSGYKISRRALEISCIYFLQGPEASWEMVASNIRINIHNHRGITQAVGRHARFSLPSNHFSISLKSRCEYCIRPSQHRTSWQIPAC